MDTALPQKFPFILDRNLAKANCTGNRVCTSCDTIVLASCHYPFSPGGSRRGEAKLCGVCGDVAKSNHFGGLSCDSCKAFFRRSVQNNAYKAFACPYERKCVIGKMSRKTCQYCR